PRSSLIMPRPRRRGTCPTAHRRPQPAGPRQRIALPTARRTTCPTSRPPNTTPPPFVPIVTGNMALETPPVPSTKAVIRWAPLVFTLATAIGVLLRLAFVGAPLPAPFDHLLHSHSHALYF